MGVWRERGLEEASVRGKNECQVKLVDTEKGLESHFRSGLHFFFLIKTRLIEKKKAPLTFLLE